MYCILCTQWLTLKWLLKSLQAVMCVEPFKGRSVCFSSPTASGCSSLFCMNDGLMATYAGISRHPFAPPRPFITALTRPYFLHGCRGIKVAWRGWGFVYRCALRRTSSVWCVVFWALMQRLENVCGGNLRSWGCRRVHLKCIIVKIHCDAHKDGNRQVCCDCRLLRR